MHKGVNQQVAQSVCKALARVQKVRKNITFAAAHGCHKAGFEKSDFFLKLAHHDAVRLTCFHC
jgi:hypothetical protein